MNSTDSLQILNLLRNADRRSMVIFEKRDCCGAYSQGEDEPHPFQALPGSRFVLVSSAWPWHGSVLKKIS